MNTLIISQFPKIIKCQRCGGKAWLENDIWGLVYDCLQCGWEKDIDTKVPEQGVLL